MLLFRIGALLLVAFQVCDFSFAQGKRVALVIGNSDYNHTPRLENPKNDAADMAAQLAKLGFSVSDKRDLSKGAMDHAIRDFAEALSGAQVGLLFYAGHGLQVGGQNYLVPIDAKLSTATAIDFEMVRLDLIHRTMEREAITNILIVDACRDNPLARNLARALGTRSTQIGRGLAPVESGEGTLISYSTQPGNVALDGTGRNSPYAEALLKHIATPGDDLPTILINVRNDVMQSTGRRQVPWEHSALTAKFFFIPPKTTAQQVELEFWASVKDSTTPSILGTYLERYPGGEFASIARALIEHFERQRKAELAAREEEKKRSEEERKTAELKRLEAERRAREVAIAEERKRAEEAQNRPDLMRLDEKAKTEWLAATEELRKALEDVRLAREAASKAETQRLEAVRAADEATRAAQKVIASKRETADDPVKVAVLPKLSPPSIVEGGTGFDGRWEVTRTGPECRGGVTLTFPVVVANGAITGGGRVAPSWAIKLQRTSRTSGRPMHYAGTLRGGSGSGTFFTDGGNCKGTFTAVRK